MDRDLSIVSQTAAKIAGDLTAQDIANGNPFDQQGFSDLHEVIYDAILAQVAKTEAQWAHPGEDPEKVVHAHFPGAVEVPASAPAAPAAPVPPPPPPAPETPPPPPRPAGGAAVPAAPAAQPVCEQCGGAVYDNRAENERRVAQGQKARPIFKCKRTECGWVKWGAR